MQGFNINNNLYSDIKMQYQNRYHYIINQPNNIDKLNKDFNNYSRISIPNIFVKEFAEILYNSVKKVPNRNWFQMCGIRNTVYKKRLLLKNNKRNKDNIKEANKTFLKNEFAFNFHRTFENRYQEISYLEYSIRKLLSGKNFINTINEITGMNVTTLKQLFLSRYRAGHFLSTHSDIGNGTLAFVINITKNWRPEYGGILHFLTEDRKTIIDSAVPKFNNLTLFYVKPDVGTPHFVSHVVPGVKETRYALTGWYE